MNAVQIYVPIIMAIIGLLFMWTKRAWVLKQDAGDGKMAAISEHIYEGALAFLKAEYKLLAVFVVLASAALLGITFLPGVKTHTLIVVAFVFGAFFSALAGNMGMRIATKTNVRTTQAARTSLPQALKVSFGGGTVMGLGVAGLAVLGLTGFFIFFFNVFMGGAWTSTEDMTIVLETLAGFSLGAESIALFARVGGGIYTKAADVGADLVGKVEAGIPEDDPRNPATIADNVGDNVGDCAGMAADLFESYEVTLVASIILGVPAFQAIFPHTPALWAAGALFPLAARAIGVLASIVGVFAVKATEKDKSAMAPINRGFLTAGLLTVVGTAVVAFAYVGNDHDNIGWKC